MATNTVITDQEEVEEYAPGELAPSIITTQKVWRPDDLKAKDLTGAIEALFKSCSDTDEAARRFSVVQTWQDRHFDRGYQHLDGDGKGGWSIAGSNGSSTRNGVSAMDDAGLYPTNIYSSQGDIVTSTLCRGKIKTNFIPKRSKQPQDVAGASMANQYKKLWEKNNCELQRDIANLGWTDCRVMLWTRTVADKRFGVDEQGQPLKMEITTAHGVLESKLPMMVDKLTDAGYAMVFEEMDYAVARAAYPWMKSKIKASWGAYGEQEFDRIARINTRIGITGKYVTGTSGIREATMAYVWFRPGQFFDDQITDARREALLENFPDGMFCVFAGPELCCAWNESIDKHAELGMFSRGFGQNRRALGSSDVPIQKRINIWADLQDKFYRTAIPITLLDDRAFDLEAVAQMESTPRRFLGVALDETQTMQEIVGQTPAPTPVPGFAEMFQWYVGPLIQSIDGATPALFGGGEGEDNTVGATQIRLNQSLERYGSPWQMMNRIIGKACYQAAKCCGENQSESFSDSIGEGEEIAVDPAMLKSGEYTYCEETVGEIPESGAQREAKVLSILDMAASNPQIASIIATPSNAREIVQALRIDSVITVDEAESEDKQLEEIEVMLETQPMLNPAYQQIQQQIQQLGPVHDQAQHVALAQTQAGAPPQQDDIDQGAQLEQELNDLNQQLQSTPQFLPSVPVAQDKSEDHATEAATLFSWMQGTEGRMLRRKAAQEPEGGPNWAKWTNNYLHWQGHEQMAEKLAAPQVPAPKATITIPADKVDDQTKVAALQAAGIQVMPMPTGAQEQEVEQIERVEPSGMFKEVKTKTKGKP